MSYYMPEKGDFITANFDPQSGHEQKGRRPALVISNTVFNTRTGLAIVCPLTGTDKHFSLHVAVDNVPNIHGFVMVEQVKSIDCSTRGFKIIGKALPSLLEEVEAKLEACL